MSYSFIACEYNPLHNGHKYQINKAKQMGADAVICIMSGNFVQRGDIAVTQKHIRAKTALATGADLVIELPLKYAVSTASYFAEGFIRTVRASGLDGFVCCGATSSDEEIRLLCDTVFSEEAEAFTRAQLGCGINYPRAKSIYIKNMLGAEYERMFNEPNNILALEYLNAIKKFSPETQFHSVRRIGAEHDSPTSVGNYSSASLLRKSIYKNESFDSLASELFAFVPHEVLEILESAHSKGLFPVSTDRFNAISMGRLISLNAEDLLSINNVNGGLENKIAKNIRSSASLNEVADKSKSKMYTHSRIRQILLNAVLGIERSDLLNGPSYIRVLGFNDCGRKIINEMKATASLPVVGNLSQLDNCEPIIRRDCQLDYIAGRLYSLCLENHEVINPEFSTPPVYYK